MMENFYLQVLAAAGGVFLSLFLLMLAFRPLAGLVFTRWYIRLVTDRYWENLFETFNIMKKMTPGRLLETELRSAHGSPPQRPFGRRKIKSPWGDLLFNPVFLHRLPVMDYQSIGTGVVIGPYSRRPLRLKIPILLGGMAYGTALSAQAKQALALGATMAGTAANTGSGPFLPAERAAAEKLVIQYSRGHWGKDLEILRQADAVEIQLGQGLWGAAPQEISPRRLARNPELRELIDVEQGEKAVIPSRLQGIKNPAELAELMGNLRRQTGGVPIGVKIGGTALLEKELALILRAAPDFLAIDGLEGGTHGGLGSTMDSMGLPTLFALTRARRFLEKQNLRGKVTLLAGGGLVTPMDFLKAMALGADAVFIGTVALIALVHTQAARVLPWEPPTAIVFNQGNQVKKLRISKAARSLERFFKAAVEEMQLGALCLGKNHLREVSLQDLSSTEQELAAYLGIAWCGRQAE